MKTVKGLLVASAHASHFYPQGVCFYFTFGGIPPKKIEPFDFYQSIWDKMMASCLESRGSISHHHGIGLIRSKWLEEEMKNRFKILKKIKKTIDPIGIMNPGKMGLNNENN
jgi:alkyldihydroxyacetonephosphate synthase